MKKLLLISIVILTMILAPKQIIAQTWLWANSVGGTADDYGNIVATDANGNVIVTGNFSSPTITFGLTTLTNVGGFDFFIVKYDGSGNVLWAKSEGGASYESGYSVATDTNGNIIVTGGFSSPSITFGTTTLTNVGYSDIFIVKYDASGNLLWAKSAGGIYNDYGNSVVTDTNGNVIVTGSFNSPSITFDSNNFTNVGYDDIFIVKYDSLGNLIWAISEGGTNGESSKSVAMDANGNIMVTGYFLSTSLTFGSTTLTNAGGSDIFIVKYDSSGNTLWAKSAGGINNDTGNGVATDDNGNVIVTGNFFSPSITFETINLTNGGYNDVFIVKYDTSGNVIWAKSTGGDNSESGKSVATLANGDIIVTGHFESPTINFETTILANTGEYDMFIVKYDASGNVIWAYAVGGTNTQSVMSVVTDSNGNMIFMGNYTGSSIFGTTTLSDPGGGDIFIAKLSAVSGVNEWSKEESFSVYPNPFSEQTVLQSAHLLNNATLTIDNYLGQTVVEIKNINEQTISLRRNNLPSGLYLFRLIEDNEVITTKKIVIAD